MSRCSGCGGVVGRDCFNPVECLWITDSINADNEQKAQQYDTVQYEYTNLRHELELANQTILSLQLANEQLQHEITLLKQEATNE